MEAGKLIQLILQANDRSKSVLPYFLGKPFTATTVSELTSSVGINLEEINIELRNELGIELYVNVIPVIQEGTVQGFLQVRKAVGYYE